MQIKDIHKLLLSGNVLWKQHVSERMVERHITRNDVRTCILNGIIIEDYPDSRAFPSALVYGKTQSGRDLHVVLGIADGFLQIITVYEPDRLHFEDDLMTRRKDD